MHKLTLSDGIHWIGDESNGCLEKEPTVSVRFGEESGKGQLVSRGMTDALMPQKEDKPQISA